MEHPSTLSSRGSMVISSLSGSPWCSTTHWTRAPCVISSDSHQAAFCLYPPPPMDPMSLWTQPALYHSKDSSELKGRKKYRYWDPKPDMKLSFSPHRLPHNRDSSKKSAGVPTSPSAEFKASPFLPWDDWEREKLLSPRKLSIRPPPSQVESSLHGPKRQTQCIRP